MLNPGLGCAMAATDGPDPPDALVLAYTSSARLMIMSRLAALNTCGAITCFTAEGNCLFQMPTIVSEQQQFSRLCLQRSSTSILARSLGLSDRTLFMALSNAASCGLLKIFRTLSLMTL